MQLKLILVPLALAIVYVIAAKLGFTMAFTAEQVTLVWPPSGLALAALLLLGTDVWPGIFLGALVANITTHEPAAAALCVAAGNTLEAVSAAWLIRRYVGLPISRSWLRCMLGVFVFGALASTTIAATIGVTSLCAAGVQPWRSFGTLWWTWWLGDATGDLIITPALLAIGTLPREMTRWQMLEVGALIAGLSAAGLVVFTRRIASAVHYPLEYLVFPFLIWSAIRFGIGGAALASVLTSAIAIWGTVHGFGPYGAGEPTPGDERLMLLHTFIGVVSTSGLLLGATVSDRDASRLRKAGMLEAALDGIISIDHLGRIIEFNPAAELAFGRTRTEAIGRDFATLVLPERRREIHRRAMAHHVLPGATPVLIGRRIETVAIRADGAEFPVELSLSRLPASGPPVFTAFLRDITEQKQMVQELAFRATHDGLTNMLNNAAFMDRLAIAARQANIGGRSDVAVLFADLNKFKAINDEFGHAVGDRLLVAIARRLRGAVRPGDSVARLGGDEFAVLLEHVLDVRDVDAVVQRIQYALDQPFNIDGREIKASASVGVSLASQHGPRPEDMLRAADEAMYLIKAARR